MQQDNTHTTRARLPGRLGLIGGMSWRSSADYYARINVLSEQRRGAHRNFPVIVDSVEFAGLLDAGARGARQEEEDILVAAGERLQTAGCTAIALTAVTAHRCHDALVRTLTVPVPHIFDATATRLAAMAATRVGLLGTSRTLAAPFLLHRVSSDGQRDILRPDQEMQGRVDALIFDCLTQGIVDDAGRNLLDAAITELRRNGADAIVLACTELPLLLSPTQPVPADVIDAVALHVSALCDTITDDVEFRST